MICGFHKTIETESFYFSPSQASPLYPQAKQSSLAKEGAKKLWLLQHRVVAQMIEVGKSMSLSLYQSQKTIGQGTVMISLLIFVQLNRYRGPVTGGCSCGTCRFKLPRWVICGLCSSDLWGVGERFRVVSLLWFWGVGLNRKGWK